MKNLMKYAAMFVLLCLASTAAAQSEDDAPQISEKDRAKAMKLLARQEAKEKQLRKKMLEEKATDEDVVYMFGVGTNFNDSVIYLTEINDVHALKLQKKTQFLPFRAEFSLQMREYLEGGLGLQNETCCMFYADKRKTLAKRYYKLKKRYLDEGGWKLVIVGQDKFSFKKPEFVDNVAM